MKIEKLENTMQGRGSNFISVEMRALENNKKHTARLRTGEKVDLVELTRKNMQYLYQDAGEAHFMDMETFEQVSATSHILGNYQYYIAEGEELEVKLSAESEVVMADTPKHTTITIDRIDEASADRVAAQKLNAQASNGRVVSGVAAFVTPGTAVVIDVETEAYVSRA
eukprot:CAMPEP_0170197552 /NCGR_PEP_ID=MMETSP0040_2-20121228/66652_1 /TAXON_ID=641309 /ORGANISM="Lotharella oceanica, Strain CCMP622" /LENGTH=167 /DNA_ID=CAMNT_0010447247 /DNA_START=66 /DNA_END=569 /DNA_ORIENTATION=-